MYSTKRMFAYGAMLALGAALLLCGMTGVVEDFWSGFGGGLMGVSLVRLASSFRYRRDKDFARKTDTENNDERNKYISEKARSWTLYFSLLLLGAGTIVFRLLDNELLSLACAYAVCGIVLLYWVCWAVLKRKY